MLCVQQNTKIKNIKTEIHQWLFIFDDFGMKTNFKLIIQILINDAFIGI